MNGNEYERLIAEVDLHLARRDCAAGLRPPDRLRERIMALVDSDEAGTDVQVWKRWTAPPTARTVPGLTTVAADRSDWQESAIAGIRTRRLAVDPERRSVTMLIEMAPGTSYPAHRHGGVEECFVIAGDLRVGDRETLRTGDYQRAEAGSEHPVQSTEGGCTLLLVSSQDDELLPDGRLD